MKVSEYKDLFISESREILASLNKNLVELEKVPSNVELLNEIFRQSHTLKGMAGSMGYEGIVKLSHKMEDILDLLRRKPMKIDKHTIDLLFQSVDKLEALIKAARKDEEKKIDISPLFGKLEGLVKGIPKEEEIRPEYKIKTPGLVSGDIGQIIKRKEEGYIIYRVTVTLDKKCKMREPRAFMALKTMEEMGEIIKPGLLYDQFKTKKLGREFELLFSTKTPPQEVKKRVKEISEVSGVKLEEQRPETTSKLDQKPEETTSKLDQKADKVHKSVEVQTIRVGLDRLDSLMDLVGELAINKIRLVQIGQTIDNKDLEVGVTQMGRLTGELQTQMMQVRLVPLAYIFDRLPRMVRDLSSDNKKEIDLDIKGSEIGLDRTILDEINDPMIHLLRNAVSHGIEEPGEREKQKKTRTGKITITAHRERNFVFIEVSDDGCGIDPKKIREIAVRKKLLSPEEASRLSDQENFMLITTPGFTITEKVTVVAGRGVGMNTVRSKVEAIGGSLSIDSVPGKGSKFTLKLPLTMAIIQALLIGISNETYCIPLSSIAETIKVSTDEIKTMEHHEVISYRDTVLPLVRLREKLGFSTSPLPLSPMGRGMGEGRLPVVVVEVGYKKAGLIVDKLLGQQEVVIKILTGTLKNIKGVAGATILGSGKVALIIDIPSLI